MITNSIANKKYLSVLVDRFFNKYQREEFPQFVDFVKEWFKFSEESYLDENGDVKMNFWKVLSNLDNFIDVNEVPNELLLIFMQQYVSNFSNVIENIPYFVEWGTDQTGIRYRILDSNDNVIYRYNNIRTFLKTYRKFLLSKGSYYSIYYLFKLFGGTCQIYPLWKDILITSSKNHVLSAPNLHTGNLSHLHGIYPNPYTSPEGTKPDWWYTWYAYMIKTDLDETLYKPIVEQLVNPAGFKITWRQTQDENLGWGLNNWNDNWGDTLAVDKNPIINFSTDEVTFPLSTPYSVSDWREVEVRNLGKASLIIDSIDLSNSIDFEIDLGGGHTPIGNTFPVLLPLYETKTINVRFIPKNTGNLSASITFVSNANNSTENKVDLIGFCV